MRTSRFAAAKERAPVMFRHRGQVVQGTLLCWPRGAGKVKVLLSGRHLRVAQDDVLEVL